MTDKKTNTELTTFIGIYVDAMLKSGYEASEVKRMVSQDLINEALVLCDDNNGSYDYYGLQSLFLSLSYVLSKEIHKMESDKGISAVRTEIEKLKFIKSYLENRIKVINNKK